MLVMKIKIKNRRQTSRGLETELQRRLESRLLLKWWWSCLGASPRWWCCRCCRCCCCCGVVIVVVHLWQIPIKDYIYNLISQQQKHSVGIVVYIVTILLSARFRVQSPDNVFLKTIINIIIIQMIMSSHPCSVPTDS